MSKSAFASRTKIPSLIGVALLVASLQACGSDDDPGSAVAAACSSSCNATAGQCNLPAVTASNCATLCDLGYTLAPACAAPYQAYVDCTGSQPLLACNGNSVTVSVSVPPCLDQLSNYLSCAVTNIQACLSLPLEDGACTQQKLGNHAQACVGAPANCTLLDGIAQGGGVGIFCCP